MEGFRQDLVHRLRRLELRMPALRERREDIRYLARHRVRQLNLQDGSGWKQLEEAAEQALEAQDYAGNVRELFNLVDHAWHEAVQLVGPAEVERARRRLEAEQARAATGAEGVPVSFAASPGWSLDFSAAGAPLRVIQEKAACEAIRQVLDHFSHTEGIGTGSITVNVANPEQVTGHNYLITFTDTTWVTQEWEYIYDDDGNVTDSTLVDVDNVALNYYTLANTTTNTVLLPRGSNVLADPNISYPVIEGLEVVVQNHPDIIEASASWTPVDAADEMWLYGVDAGGAILGGGVMFGANFFGSTLAVNDMKTVEVRLTSNQADWSACATYTRPGYPFAGIGQFPGSAWDTTVDPPRRLNLCFVENVADGVDGLWNPGNAALGGRHYLFIMDSDYNAGVDYNDDNWGPAADVLWAWWPRLLDDATPFADQLAAAPGAFTFVAAQPFVGGVDQFTIATTAANRSAVTYTLDKIRAVPNPYYGHSAYETKSDVKVVKLINLPDVATIKIFNIAGDHVRTLHKTSGTAPELSWDLKNEYGVYIASGVYVYYVESPVHGDTFGKMAVMLEEERLKEY